MQTSQVVEPQVYCRICAAGNLSAAKFCQTCWSHMGTPITTLEEAELLRRRLDWRRLRRIIFRFSMLAAAMLAIPYYTWDELNNDLVPLPASRVEAVTGPGQWASSGRDAAHTARLTENFNVVGELLWTYQTELAPNPAPAVVDGVVYLATKDAQVVALDASDGRLIWEHKTNGPLDITPAVTPDKVYVGLRDGSLQALRREDGQLQWSFAAPTTISAAPLVAHGTVYAGTGDGTVYALDAETGVKLWSVRAGRSSRNPSEGLKGEWISGTPVLQGDILAVASLNGNVHFVDVRTGLRRLKYSALDITQTSVAFAGDRLVMATDLGKLFAIDSSVVDYSPEEKLRRLRRLWFLWGLQDAPPRPKGLLWATQIPRRIGFNSPAVTDEQVYVAAKNGTLFSFDLATGELVWSHEGGASSESSAVVVGDSVYYGTSDGNVHVVDRHKGTSKSVLHVGSPVAGQLVVASGTLFVSSTDGVLYALK